MLMNTEEGDFVEKMANDTSKLGKIIDRYFDAWETRGFSEDGCDICAYYALSEDMHKNFGTSEEAFLKLIEFTETAETEEEVIEKIERLALRQMLG